MKMRIRLLNFFVILTLLTSHLMLDSTQTVIKQQWNKINLNQLTNAQEKDFLDSPKTLEKFGEKGILIYFPNIIFNEETKEKLLNLLNEFNVSGILFETLNFMYIKEPIFELLFSIRSIFPEIKLFPNEDVFLQGEIRFVNINNLTETKLTTLIELIGAPTFWNNSFFGKDIIVGVIDSGVDKNAIMLKNKVIYEKSFVDTKYGYPNYEDPSDGLGHGTVIASIIAGNYSNYILGVAPKARIMNAKVISSTLGYGTTAGVLAALEWCMLGNDGEPNTGDDADIINLSLGREPRLDDPLELAVAKAVSMGKIVITAAGNWGEGGLFSMSIISPGSSPATITVGATTTDGKFIQYYSSIGPSLHLIPKPDIVAPGYGETPLASLGKFIRGEGTSFATAYVSGAVALIINLLRDRGILNILEHNLLARLVLQKSASQIKNYGYLSAGYGLINLTRAYHIIDDVIGLLGTSSFFFTTLEKLPLGYKSYEPFYPYHSKIFVDQIHKVGIPIYSTVNQSLSFALLGNITRAIKIEVSKNISTAFFDVIYIRLRGLNAEEGYYNGTIMISNGVYELNIPIGFYLQKPVGYVALDEVYTNWFFDSFYGQFRELASLLEEKNVSFEHILSSGNYVISHLKKYDVLIMANPASFVDIYDVSKKPTERGFRSFDEQTLLVIQDFVDNGGVLILLTGPSEQLYLDEINKLSKKFGVIFENQVENTTKNQTITPMIYPPIRTLKYFRRANVNSNYYLMRNISILPFYGSYLKITKSYVTPIAWVDNKPILGMLINGNGGVILFSGTNLLFDNWGLTGFYNDLLGSYNFANNLIEFIFNERQNFRIETSYKELTLEEKVNINVKLPKKFTLLKLTLKDFLGSRNLSSTFTNGTYISFFSIRVAGENILIVNATYEIWSILITSTILVNQSESIPPNISPKSGTYILISMDTTSSSITIKIKDESPIAKLNFSVEVEKRYELELIYISNVSNEKSFRITFKPKEMNILPIQQDSIFLKINATDANLNSSYSIIKITIITFGTIHLSILMILTIIIIYRYLKFLKEQNRIHQKEINVKERKNLKISIKHLKYF